MEKVGHGAEHTHNPHILTFDLCATNTPRISRRVLFFLDQIIRNLIDIPSTFQLERLEQQEAQNRSNEYMSALNTVKLPKQAIRKLYSMTSVKGSDEENSGVVRSSTSSGHSIKAPSVRELLSEKTVDPKTIDWVRTSHQSALINGQTWMPLLTRIRLDFSLW